MADDVTDRSLPSIEVANEALNTVASEQRLKIIMVLGDACDDGDYGWLRFSDVLATTGIDDSGKLNYHLKKLIANEYVVDGDEGYRLALRGLQAYQAIKAGFNTDELEIEPFPIESYHDVCGGQLYAFYENRRAHVKCSECDVDLHRYPLHPGPIDEDSKDQLLDALDTRLAIDTCAMFQGYCPYCSGSVQKDVGYEHLDQMDVNEWEVPPLIYLCNYCHWFLYSTIGGTMLYHPVVTSFFNDRGVDVWDTRKWRGVLTPDDSLVSEEPLEVELEFTCGSDSLTVAVDEDLTVLRSTIRRTH